MKKQNNIKLKFLADLNISVKTVDFLKSLDIDIIRIDKSEAKDEEVIEKAIKENRIILTFKEKITIVILYLEDQRYENVNEILKKFIFSIKFSEIENKLIILYKNRYRLIQ